MKKRLTDFFDKTFIKFLLVGVANTLFGSAVMFGLYNIAHCGYWVSTAANYIFGSVLSYFLNKYFTFQYQEKSVKVLMKFTVNIVLCYLIAYGMAKPLVRMLTVGANQRIQDNVSMLVGMGVFVVLNYIGQRFWAFKSDRKQE